jgi:uncharacterized delta-60 repeat protein
MRSLFKLSASAALCAASLLPSSASASDTGDSSVRSDATTPSTVAPDTTAVAPGTTTVDPDTTSPVSAQPSVARLEPEGSRTLASVRDWLGSSFDTVHDFVRQPDGKVVIVGSFTTVRGYSRWGVARLNANGSLDTSFMKQGGGVSDSAGSPVYVSVYHVALQPDGNIIIAGNFGKFQGQPAHGVARLNKDGSLDTSFKAAKTTLNPDVSDMILLANRKIIIKSSYDTNLTRLLSDGSIDKSFRLATLKMDSITAQPSLYEIVEQPDGKLLIFGRFDMVGSHKRPSVARLNADGSLDTSFAPVLSRTLRVEGVLGTLQPDGKIVVSWSASSKGKSTHTVTRLFSDGKTDKSFAIGSNQQSPICPLRCTPSSSFKVASVNAQQDGKIVLIVTSLEEPENVNFIARVLPSGATDKSFYPVQFSSFAPGPGWYTQIKQAPNGSLLVSGSFPSLYHPGTKLSTRHSLASVLQNGSYDPRFIPGR